MTPADVREKKKKERLKAEKKKAKKAGDDL